MRSTPLYQKKHERSSMNLSRSASRSTSNMATPRRNTSQVFARLCHRYVKSKDATAAKAAEQFPDSMNIDKAWCKFILPVSVPNTPSVALRLESGKASRVFDLLDYQLTCFLRHHKEAKRMSQIPRFRTIQEQQGTWSEHQSLKAVMTRLDMVHEREISDFNTLPNKIRPSRFL